VSLNLAHPVVQRAVKTIGLIKCDQITKTMTMFVLYLYIYFSV